MCCSFQSGCSISCLYQASDWPTIQCCWANITTCCTGTKLQGVFLCGQDCPLIKYTGGLSFLSYCCFLRWDKLCPTCTFKYAQNKNLHLIKDGRRKTSFLCVIKCVWSHQQAGERLPIAANFYLASHCARLCACETSCQGACQSAPLTPNESKLIQFFSPPACFKVDERTMISAFTHTLQAQNSALATFVCLSS